MDGIKTGFINASGYNIASAVDVNGRRVIGVVLGGKTARQRDNRMADLLDQVVPGGSGLPGVAVAATGQQKRPAEGVATRIAEAPVPRPRTEIILGETTASAASVTPYATPPKALPMEAMARQGGMQGAPVWDIQIAAAGSQSAATGALNSALPLLSDFGQIAPSVQGSSSGGREIYRARLTGFADRDSAAKACSVLQTRSIDCFVVR